MKHYKAFALAASLIILCIGIFYKEMWLSIIASVCSTVYIITLSAGKRYAFLFGAAYCVTFSYISFINGLYATAIFFFCYLFPVLIASFFRNAASPERTKPLMRFKKWTATVMLAVIIFVILSVILFYTNDAQPYLDSLNFSAAAVTSLLMLLGHKEFWITNTLTCCVSITMWVIQFAVNSSGVNIILLNVIALASSIIGVINWKKSLRQDVVADMSSSCKSN